MRAVFPDTRSIKSYRLLEETSLASLSRSTMSNSSTGCRPCQRTTQGVLVPSRTDLLVLFSPGEGGALGLAGLSASAKIGGAFDHSLQGQTSRRLTELGPEAGSVSLVALVWRKHSKYPWPDFALQRRTVLTAGAALLRLHFERGKVSACKFVRSRHAIR